MQATPHVTDVQALVVRFHTVPIVPLGIPDGLLEVISGFLVNHWIARVVGISELACALTDHMEVDVFLSSLAEQLPASGFKAVV